MTDITLTAQRAVYWNAMREVCADLRRFDMFGDSHWHLARRRTLQEFYALWREAYDAAQPNQRMAA